MRYLMASLVACMAFAPRAMAAEHDGAERSLAPAPVRYLRERALDVLDVFELNVGAGPGAKASVKYGVQFFGLGDVRSRRVGTIDRRMGWWREIDTEFGILPLSVLAWPVHWAAKAAGRDQLAMDARFVARAGSEGFEHLDRKELHRDPTWIMKDTVSGPVHTRWADCFIVGAEVHAFVGARAMVRPLEVVDLAVGLVGIELDPWLERNPAR